MTFPKVTTRRTNSGWIAGAALSLRAIDWEGFHAEGQTAAECFASRHRATARLLHAFSRWRVPASLELRLASYPSLDNDTPGCINLSIRLRCSGPTQELTIERCLTHFLSLTALLAAFWPHTDWEPAEGESGFATTGFKPLSCMAVLRRKRHVAMTRPFLVAAQPLGFQNSAAVPCLQSAGIEHVYPWVSSWENGPALLDALLAYPPRLSSSLVFPIRLKPHPPLRVWRITWKSASDFCSAAPSSQVAPLGASSPPSRCRVGSNQPSR